MGAQDKRIELPHDPDNRPFETVSQLLTDAQAQMLSSSRTGHLATADVNGVPHVVPVCFAWNGQFLYSPLDQKPKRAALRRLRRVRNILTNPNVALVADHYEEDWRQLWYILVTGTAELVEAGPEQAAAITLLREKYDQYRDMDIDGNPVIKITPTRAVSWGGGG